MSLFVRIDSHVIWELSAHMVRIFMHLSIDLSLVQKREDQRLHVVVPRVNKQDHLLKCLGSAPGSQWKQKNLVKFGRESSGKNHQK